MFQLSFAAVERSADPVVVPDGGTLAALNAALDHAAVQRGDGAWQPPAVITARAALAQAFARDALAGRMPAEVDFVLSRDQELALWQEVIGADRALEGAAATAAAPLAREAWWLQHAWGLPPPAPSAPASADVLAFRRWAGAYRARTAALAVTDEARLLQGTAHAPGPCAAHAFLDPPPRLARWLGGGSAPERTPGAGGEVHVAAFRDREQELHAALEWAGACAAARPGARVVVAVDSLLRDAELARRCASDVLGAPAPGRSPCLFSAREPLAARPALRLLVLLLEATPVMRWDAVSELVLHPLLPAAAEERAARALLDATLRERERHELPLALITHSDRHRAACPRLAAVLEAVLATQHEQPRRQRLVAWLAHFDAALGAAGWPGAIEPPSERVRMSAVWGEICDRLNTLDAVLPPVTRGDALARLKRMLADARAPATAPAAGIFVVTPAEALALEPHALWLAGCESDALLGARRPSPLLPLAQQRQAGVPGADPLRDLDVARRLVDTLLGSAGECHASYAAGDAELRLAPSPLLPALGAARVADAAAVYVPHAWRQPAPRFERFEDFRGPALVTGAAAGGGAALFAAQAACAFLAFARHRLSARELEEPRPGLSAREKGTLVHQVLAAVWQRLGDSAALAALDDAARDALVGDAIAAVLRLPPWATPVERELLGVERERLQRLLGGWLAYECGRGAFTVAACEVDVEVEFEGLALRLRIDRVDQRDDGRAVVVDYKTGACAAGDWQWPRMNQPQLPLYALTAPFQAVAAIAFARVDSADPRWIERPDPVRSGPDEFGELRAAWHADLAALADDFAAGIAVLDPKYGRGTCARCEQSLLCRRRELLEAAADDDADAGGDDD